MEFCTFTAISQEYSPFWAFRNQPICRSVSPVWLGSNDNLTGLTLWIHTGESNRRESPLAHGRIG